MRGIGGLTVIALIVAAGLLGGCGGGGGGDEGSTAAEEKADDAEILNVAIGQELTLVEAFSEGLPLLRRPEARVLFRQFIAQEREHIDGYTHAMRGLGGEV